MTTKQPPIGNKISMKYFEEGFKGSFDENIIKGQLNKVEGAGNNVGGLSNIIKGQGNLLTGNSNVGVGD